MKGSRHGLGDISKDGFRCYCVEICGLDIVRYCHVNVVRYGDVDIAGDRYSCCREDGRSNCGLFRVLMVVLGGQRPYGKKDEQAK